ncbi:MAG TPA: ribonuclease HII [Candidatus Omnitrophota bacterium]|nr:ribonuclease HII [Candidatus Omnitrophota bacterium]
MFKLGIDEAGRGPVIGPLVIAGCLIDEKLEKKLKKLGVKDSKKLTRKKRDELNIDIRKLAETFEIIIIPPVEIEDNNKRGILLNELEAIAAAEIINRINRGFSKIRVVIDCPNPKTETWREIVVSKIKDKSNLEVVCEHKADVNHVATSAASVLAKCVRDKEMDCLKEKFGKVGSGYCHDPVTIKFIQENLKKYEHDGIFRKTWSTWKDALEKASQKKLGDF